MTETVFVDTNVFVVTLLDEPGRGEAATEFLNADFEFHTSLLNLMELRTVLTKKKRLEQPEAAELIDEIAEEVNVFIHEASDVLAANRLQQETLLYPMDAFVFAAADDQDATLVSFDAELLEAGAVEPAELLH